jgi:hypothetical protein
VQFSSRFNKKGVTSSYHNLDIRSLKKDGLFKAKGQCSVHWSAGDKPTGSIGLNVARNRLGLTYRVKSQTSDWQKLSYDVDLEWTKCPFGGQRPWFRCPNRSCGRRALVLYLRHYFICRSCAELVYQCQRETALDRKMRRLDRLKKDLGWGLSMCSADRIKPKGMHWRKYQKIVNEVVEIEQYCLRSMLVSMEALWKKCA